MMKESKFVRTKIVVGYVLIALIGLTAMIYVWRQTGALLEPDHSQQEPSAAARTGQSDSLPSL
ncbi:MAG: hypothetical protein ACLURY_01175 [Alistipes putredinis]